MIGCLVSAGIFLTYAAVKNYVERHFASGERHFYQNGRFSIEKYHNRGMAFEVVNISPGTLLKAQGGMLCAAAAIQGVLALQKKGRLTRAGLTLLLGGGASNFFDRYRRGYVVDYFRIHAGPKRLRRIVYNISDFCIFTGAVLIVIGVRRKPKSVSPKICTGRCAGVWKGKTK